MSKRGAIQDQDSAILLQEMERFLLNASPSEVEEILAEMGLTERAAAVSKKIQRALEQDFSQDLASDEVLAQAALVESHRFTAKSGYIPKLRLRFLLAAEPDLAKALGVDSHAIDGLSDDVAGGLYERAVQMRSSA